jgi:sugar lactone lactonase YvrE
MKGKRFRSVLIALVVSFIVSCVLIQGKNAFSWDEKGRWPYHVELLTTLPTGTFMENLVWDHEGQNLYITYNTDGEILKYSYARNSWSIFATLTYPGSLDGRAHPLGIAIDDDGTIYGAAVKWPLTPDGAFIGKNGIFKIDKQGKWEWFMEQVPGAVWNGWTYFQPGVFLICDAYAGLIWKLDVKTKMITVWVQDPLLNPILGDRTPGANGIKLYKNFAYVSSSAQALILKIPIDQEGNAGKVEIYKDNIIPDDFCISENGHIYATTHPQNVIYLVKKRGKPEIIAGPEDWRVKGNTAAVFGRNKHDSRWIYVVGDGGVWECQNDESCLEMATLVRIYVGEKGYFGQGFPEGE